MNSGKACRSIKGQTIPFAFQLLLNRSPHRVARIMRSMASPSHYSHRDYKLKSEEDGGDWLQLGLGSGTGCRKLEGRRSNPVSGLLTLAASSSSPLNTNHQTGLGLGLGLGLDMKSGLDLGFDIDSVRHVAPPRSNYDNLWPDNCNYHYQYFEDDDHNGSPSWPWHKDSGSAFLGLQNWQMPVPNAAHDYSTRRPQSGLWFSLRSLTNRDGEALPQIQKAYIRVKDENMTVFMVKKYLLRKLALSNEAEIDISCMGQNLLQTETLKQVRDAVWLPRLLDSIHSTLQGCSLDMSPKHLMSLHYERRCVLD